MPSNEHGVLHEELESELQERQFPKKYYDKFQELFIIISWLTIWRFCIKNCKVCSLMESISLISYAIL